MAVFPSQSKQFLPIEWQSQMTAKESPIIDFYPLNFCVDLNGKRYEWQGVALLPFVEEKRLHRTLKQVYSTLTCEEERRNKRDYDRLYLHSTGSGFDVLKELYEKESGEITRKSPMDLPAQKIGGMAGRIWPDDSDKIVDIGGKLTVPLPNCEELDDNQVISVKYRDLAYDDDYIFQAKLLENVVLPTATLKPRDYDQMHPYRPNLGFAQHQQYQRDFAPAQRFIRHSVGSQSSYQHHNQQYNSQQQGGFFPERQQGQYQSNNYHRNQSYQSQSYPRHQYQQHHQNDYGGPRQNFRPRMPSYQQRPYQNYNNNNSNNYNQRQNSNGGGSWS